MNRTETLKKVFSYLRRYWYYLLGSLLLAALTVALTLYVPILTGDAVDNIIGAGQVDFQAIFSIVVKILIAVAVTSAGSMRCVSCE